MRRPRAREFLSLRIHYDPYSATAETDYQELMEQLEEFDVIGMLAREVGKTRIHQPMTRRLISTVRHLSPEIKNAAVRTMLKSLDVLYPVFPQVMLLLKAVLTEIDGSLRTEVFQVMRKLVQARSFLVRPPINLAFIASLRARWPAAAVSAL